MLTGTIPAAMFTMPTNLKGAYLHSNRFSCPISPELMTKIQSMPDLECAMFWNTFEIVNSKLCGVYSSTKQCVFQPIIRKFPPLLF